MTSPQPASRATPQTDVQTALKMSEAVAWHQRGDWRRAAAAYAEVLAGQPDHPDALYLLGAVAIEAGQVKTAVTLLQRALAVRPRDADTLHSLGVALDQLKRHDEALRMFDEALDSEPAMAVAWTNRGDCLAALGRCDEALASHARAVAAAPDRTDIRGRQADCLLLMGHDAQAIEAHDLAIATDPLDPALHVARARALDRMGRVDDALTCCDTALDIAPHSALASYHKGLFLLSRGDFERGWILFEQRWATRHMWQVKRSCPEPLWLGEEPLSGKTILLHNDQGLGDAIMLSRFAATVAAMGAQVVLEVQPELVELLRGVDGVRDCVAKGEPAPAHDLHCPLFSLPMALRLRVDSVPAADGYLRSDAVKAQAWAKRLGQCMRPRVGLAWSGNPRHDNDRHRTLTLAQLVAALPPCCEYVSLQPLVRDADRPVLQATSWLHDFSADLHDFSDTAALCEAMDLVVCVDTSVGHLGGAMAKPTWILLPYPAEYRWLREREDTPWYASARLMRQSGDRQWGPVLARLRAQLQAWADAFAAA